MAASGGVLDDIHTTRSMTIMNSTHTVKPEPQSLGPIGLISLWPTASVNSKPNKLPEVGRTSEITGHFRTTIGALQIKKGALGNSKAYTWSDIPAELTSVKSTSVVPRRGFSIVEVSLLLDQGLDIIGTVCALPFGFHQLHHQPWRVDPSKLVLAIQRRPSSSFQPSKLCILQERNDRLCNRVRGLETMPMPNTLQHFNALLLTSYLPKHLFTHTQIRRLVLLACDE